MSERTDEDARWLLQFALANYPHHVATSALIAADRTVPLDAEPRAPESPAHLPSSTDGAALDACGWQPPRADPELVASMVLGRQVELSVANVAALAELARPDETDATPVAGAAAARATEMLARMQYGIYTASPEQGLAADDPLAVQALYRLSHYDPHLSDAERRWTELALRQGLDRTWTMEQVDAALALLGGGSGAATPLLARASAECARSLLLRPSTPEAIQRVAVARLRELGVDVAEPARATLAMWLDAHPVGDPSADRWPTRYHRALGPVELELVQVVPASERTTIALAVLDRGYPVSLVRPLVDECELAVVERHVLGAFAARPTLHLATCLLALGKLPTLLDGLSGTPELASICVEACSTFMDARQPLLERMQSDDLATALGASRALTHDWRHRDDLGLLARLHEHATDERAPLRMQALEYLKSVRVMPGLRASLRATYGERTPTEQRLVLRVLARQARSDAEATWVLSQPLLDGETLLARAAVLRRIPAAWLDRLFDLLLEEPRLANQARRLDAAKALQERAQQRGMMELARALEPEIDVMGRRAGTAGRTETGPVQQHAYFTVVAPGEIAPREMFVLEAVVHTQGKRDAVASWTSQKDPRMFSVGSKRLPADANVEVTFGVPGIEIDERTVTFGWGDELGIAQVVCRVPADAAPGSLPGTAVFRVEGAVLAETRFVLTVGAGRAGRKEVTTATKTVRSAFASYATPDRERVLARLQGIQKAAPFIDIFLDVISLRSGDRWAETIGEQIRARDVLYLFWSQAASESHHVETEWRTALAEHGLTGIDPVPLDSPREVPPPPELAELHFHDWTLTFSDG